MKLANSTDQPFAASVSPPPSQAVPIAVAIIPGQVTEEHIEDLRVGIGGMAIFGLAELRLVDMLIREVRQNHALTSFAGVILFSVLASITVFVFCKQRSRKLQIVNALRSAEGFSASAIYIDEDLGGIAIDETARTACLVSHREGGFDLRFLEAGLVSKVWVEEDGHATHATTPEFQGGQIMSRAAAATPPILENFGKRQRQILFMDTVSELDLVVEVRSAAHPVHRVSFLPSTIKWRGSAAHRSRLPEAQQWAARLNALRDVTRE